MSTALVIPLAGILMPMVLAISIVRMKHRQIHRRWRHEERLRALEMGLTLPEPEPRLSSGSVVAIGAGVPAASVLAAALTSLHAPYGSPQSILVIAVSWGSATLVSTEALIISLVLGIMLVRSHGTTGAAESLTAKPACEPDAFDVVSCRG
ncbi:MAG: hypothetical protein ACLP7Q_03080 [Isosphaeraceae bacterium]